MQWTEILDHTLVLVSVIGQICIWHQNLSRHYTIARVCVSVSPLGGRLAFRAVTKQPITMALRVIAGNNCSTSGVTFS